MPIDRISPTLRPRDRPAGFQRWRHLLFLHWQVPVEVLRPLIPSALEIDTHEGQAWVGVVPFTMRDVAPSWAPPVPGISNFDEVNVRTYVHHAGRDPGVWFFSLDAASSVAVLAARAGWHLPYHRARMRMDVDGALVRYTSVRRWPGPKPADLEVRYQIGDEIGNATPGTLEHFLAERYVLYATKGAGPLRVGRVHHRPYALRHAAVLDLRESMVAAAGMPQPAGEPHVLYSPAVDVDIFALRPLG